MLVVGERASARALAEFDIIGLFNKGVATILKPFLLWNFVILSSQSHI